MQAGEAQVERSMRAKALAAAVLGMGLVLSACGGDGEGSGGEGATTELKWWMVTQQADTATAAIKKTISDFEKANPNIKVKVEYRGIDPLKDALRTSAGSSSGPDIYYMWAGPGLGGEFVDAGVSLDLTKYYEQYKWTDRFVEGTLKNYTQYGGYHGVPWTQRGEAIFYNKALFAKAGITQPPASYAELTDVAAKLKSAGITPIAFGGKDNWHVMRLLDSMIETNCGTQKGDQLNTLKAQWAGEPCVSKSFTELKQWADNYFNPGYIGLAQSEAANLFITAKAAMAYEGDWLTQQIVDTGGPINDIGVFVFPTGTNRLYGFSEGMYISKSSKHPDDAAKFLDYLTSDKVQQETASNFAAISVNKNVKLGGESNPVQDQMSTFITGAKAYYLNNDQNFPLEVTTEYWRIQNAVLTGDIAPGDAGNQLQKFIDSHK